jgi:nitrite reductase/ring-hydroxylating ferredoxin subunit
MADERRRPQGADDADGADADRFDTYLDALLGGGRPSPDAVGDRDEAEMARLAAEMAAAGSGTAVEPDPAFLDQLRRRMREADAGIAAVRTPPPVREPVVPGGVHRWRLSRRQVIQAGIGAAAGMAAGMLGAILRPAREVAERVPNGAPLVSGEGFWIEVARLDELLPGDARRFSTTAFDGFVVNDAGTVRALASTCTHMGCTLAFRPDWQDLRCPCHGASFDLEGRLANSRSRWREEGAYRGDARAYPIELPDLPRPEVKVEDGTIYVWTAQA